MSDYPPVDDIQDDPHGEDLSTIQEERYLLTIAREAQRIVHGKSMMLITKEHARALLKLLEMYADELFEEKDNEF